MNDILRIGPYNSTFLGGGPKGYVKNPNILLSRQQLQDQADYISRLVVTSHVTVFLSDRCGSGYKHLFDEVTTRIPHYHQAPTQTKIVFQHDFDDVTLDLV